MVWTLYLNFKLITAKFLAFENLGTLRYTIPQAFYTNKTINYTAIFHGCKKDDFQMKTHNLCFRAKIRKTYTPVNPSFIIHRWGVRGSTWTC